MICSMTGFGKAVSEIRDKKLVVEVRSLNSRQQSKYRIAGFLETRNRKSLATKAIERGKADAYILKITVPILRFH